ncbi:MAG: hypothetical protein WKG01_40515, partial [Kofleriaceae bacterium]
MSRWPKCIDVAAVGSELDATTAMSPATTARTRERVDGLASEVVGHGSNVAGLRSDLVGLCRCRWWVGMAK